MARGIYFKKLFFCGDPSGEQWEARTQLLLYGPAKTHTTCCPNDQIPTTMLLYASFSVSFTSEYAKSPSETVKSHYKCTKKNLMMTSFNIIAVVHSVKCTRNLNSGNLWEERGHKKIYIFPVSKGIISVILVVKRGSWWQYFIMVYLLAECALWWAESAGHPLLH